MKYAAGSIYHEVRRRRELRIKEVRGNLHQSTISHLEHDTGDMTLNTMMKILKPTFMSAEEFCQLIDEQSESPTFIFKKIARYYDEMNVAGLKQLVTVYKRDKLLTTPNRLVLLTIQSCIDELSEKKHLLSQDDCDFVQGYLLHPGRWFSFEYIVFANLSFSMPAKINLRVSKKMVRAYEQFHLPSYDSLLVNVLYNLSTSFLDQEDPKLSARFLNFLDLDKLNHNNLYMRHHITFLELVIRFQTNPLDKANVEKLKVFLEATRLIDETLFKKNIDWIESLKINPVIILGK